MGSLAGGLGVEKESAQIEHPSLDVGVEVRGAWGCTRFFLCFLLGAATQNIPHF